MIDNILGNKTSIRILRLLSRSVNRYFTIKEIRENTGLGFGNVFNSLNLLEYHNLILKGEKKVKTYKINFHHSFNEQIIKIYKDETTVFQNIDLETLRIIAEFEQEVIKKLTGVKSIILFGSVARGAYSEKSDMDIAIIKHGKTTKDKITLSKIIGRFQRNIQPHIFTEHEYKKSTEPLIKNIKKEGITLGK